MQCTSVKHLFTGQIDCLAAEVFTHWTAGSIQFAWLRIYVLILLFNSDWNSRHDLSHRRWIPLCVLSWNSRVAAHRPLRRSAKRSVLACSREQRYKLTSMLAKIDMISKLHIIINEPNDVQIERNYIVTMWCSNVFMVLNLWKDTRFFRASLILILNSSNVWSIVKLHKVNTDFF